MRYTSFENSKYLVQKELLETEKGIQYIGKVRERNGRNHWILEVNLQKIVQ